MRVGEWAHASLGEVAEISWGDTKTTKASYTPMGWHAYSASGADGYLPYYDHDGAGVVISAIGALCGKTWFATGRWSCIKNTMWMRGNPACADTSFLFHATRRPDFWPRRGAAQPFISLGDARSTTVSLPPLPHQRRIAAILSAFDALVEINERRIELLEDLARSLYREWFVHFRFPGNEDVELVDSRLGPIPEDWDIRGLFELADIGFGFPFKSSLFADVGKCSVIRIRDLPRGATNTFTDEEPDPRYRVVDGDILVGMDGEFYVRQWSGGEAWLNQRVARLRPVGDLSSRHFDAGSHGADQGMERFDRRYDGGPSREAASAGGPTGNAAA